MIGKIETQKKIYIYQIQQKINILNSICGPSVKNVVIETHDSFEVIDRNAFIQTGGAISDVTQAEAATAVCHTGGHDSWRLPAHRGNSQYGLCQCRSI
jgi:hypothetical protein